MTADEFVKAINKNNSPVERLSLVQEAIECGIIQKRQAMKLLDFERPTHLKLVVSKP